MNDDNGESPPPDGKSVAEKAATPASGGRAEVTETSPTAEPTGGKTGSLVISRHLKQLPNSPGVYRMLDAAGDVIYVGKARSLKARVSSYTRTSGHTNRIARMIAATANMEFVTVRTEAEALLLEANLIKRFRPRFNVLMRDDKSFPYILIARDHEAPQILKHRGARNRKGDYFGPFASAGAVNRTINMLQRAFLLRSCSDSVYESRSRPCLLHQIKRCSAPCTGEISTADYARLVDEAVRFLKGESQNVRAMYQKLMQEASEALEFEQAAVYRNRLWALAHVTADQSINPEGVEEADVFAAHQEGGQTSVQVFFIRTGQNWGNRAYFPKADRSLPVEDVLDAFIAQFYDDKPAPRLILLSVDVPNRALLAEALTTKCERRVEIRVPQRGTKSTLVEHALSNAREALGRKLAESSSQKRLLEALAERFGLPHTPRRIEVYDNSHIQGTNAVGAMIVAGADGFIKKEYRKFNIKSDAVTPGDDYAMMREVLTRRFKRLARPGASDPSPAGGANSETGDGVGGEDVRGEVGAVARTHAGHITGIEAEVDDPAALGASRIVAPAASTRRLDELAFSSLSAPSRAPSSPSADAAAHLIEGNAADPSAGAGMGTGIEGDFEHDEADEPDASRDDDLADEPVPQRPDLILIDGGLGQLAVAVEVARDLAIDDIALVGVAKGPDRDAGREHFHLPGRDRLFMLEPRDPVLYFVQRLRDEAHRFAIGAHRAKRSKAIGVNPLDDIAGIGPTRKRALMTHFGSAKAVSRAGIEDLKAVEGISGEMAQKIYDFFHDRRS
ncbi:MAG: excinuclease ABC subunit UvrC [Hyphomicrobiaceae bacterium]|nr:excinuclease ABC subunit UvrC [Hyphomicrobiaceae bacterium]